MDSRRGYRFNHIFTASTKKNEEFVRIYRLGFFMLSKVILGTSEDRRKVKWGKIFSFLKII